MHEIIFERFKQADNSATREYGGTGLGLALSKGYVELLGGKISLASEPGQGSVFIFTLPYSPLITASPGIVNDQEVPGIIFPPGKIILVAEDEIKNFLMIEELLFGIQLKAVHVKNGLEALNKCTDNKLPDLLLKDIIIPVMNGIKATKRIKELNPGIPVVALTNYTLEVDKDRIFESDCVDYLEKPIKHN